MRESLIKLNISCFNKYYFSSFETAIEKEDDSGRKYCAGPLILNFVSYEEKLKIHGVYERVHN